MRGTPPAQPGAATAGDIDAVFRADYPTLVRLACVITGNAEASADLVGEAFADLLDTEGVRDPAAWLRVAVTRRSRSWVRRAVVARRYLERYGPAEQGVASEGPAAATPERVAVRDALARLDPDQRAAVYLRYYLDRPEAEIAAALGCRPGTVKSRLSRAMRRLREELS